MSKFDELKRLAQQATGSQWEFDRAYTPFSIQGGEVVGDDELPWGDVSTKEEYEFLDDDDGEPVTGPLTICTEIGLANGRFIAAANPAAILELLAIQAQLVEVLANIAEPSNAGCGCSFPCRCDSDGAEAINAGSMRSEAQEALSVYYAATRKQP